LDAISGECQAADTTHGQSAVISFRTSVVGV
jgi:hypothetical protein